MVAQMQAHRFDIGGQSARQWLEQPALWRQRHVARVAVKQPHAELRLQSRNHLAECRLRNVAAFGGQLELPAFRQRQEGAHQAP